MKLGNLNYREQFDTNRMLHKFTLFYHLSLTEPFIDTTVPSDCNFKPLIEQQIYGHKNVPIQMLSIIKLLTIFPPKY